MYNVQCIIYLSNPIEGVKTTQKKEHKKEASKLVQGSLPYLINLLISYFTRTFLLVPSE